MPVAVIASYIDEYKLVNKCGRLIKATKRFGDEDVWDYLIRSPEIQWVYVRDHKSDIYYHGRIEACSEPYRDRELLMREVEVYKALPRSFYIRPIWFTFQENLKI